MGWGFVMSSIYAGSHRNVYSSRWNGILIEEKNLDEMYGNLKNGDFCKIATYVSPRKRNGKEKGNRKVFIDNWDDRVTWYNRKAERFGFEIGINDIYEDGGIPFINEKAIHSIYFKHEDADKNTFYKAIETEMLIKITDIEKFKELLYTGMTGGGKAYGVGITLAKKIS